MTAHTPFDDLARYKRPYLPTPPAADILAAIRAGQTYDELAAVYGVSASLLHRRVTDSGLVSRRQGQQAAEVTTQAEDESWREQALCAQTDPEAHFPDMGNSVRAAKRTCSACPVVAECLAYALAHDERWGVWGNTAPMQRRAMKRGQS